MGVEDLTFVGRRAVCPRCEGEQFIANPAFDGMSLHVDNFDGDYEEREEFIKNYTKRGGIYDIPCPCCNGNGTVTRVEAEEWFEAMEYEAEREAERRMDC